MGSQIWIGFRKSQTKTFRQKQLPYFFLIAHYFGVYHWFKAHKAWKRICWDAFSSQHRRWVVCTGDPRLALPVHFQLSALFMPYFIYLSSESGCGGGDQNMDDYNATCGIPLCNTRNLTSHHVQRALLASEMNLSQSRGSFWPLSASCMFICLWVFHPAAQRCLCTLSFVCSLCVFVAICIPNRVYLHRDRVNAGLSVTSLCVAIVFALTLPRG